MYSKKILANRQEIPTNSNGRNNHDNLENNFTQDSLLSLSMKKKSFSKHIYIYKRDYSSYEEML